MNFMWDDRTLLDLLVQDCMPSIAFEPTEAGAIDILQTNDLYTKPQKISHWQIAHYAAAEAWLLDYQPDATTKGLGLVTGYVEAIGHLREVKDWVRTERLFLSLLTIEGASTSVCDFLHDRGYYNELAELGERLYDDLSKQCQALIHLKIGNAKRAFGYYAEAIIHYSWIEAVAHTGQLQIDPEILGDTYYGMGMCLCKSTQIHQAKAYFLQHLELGQKTGHAMQIAKAEMGLGWYWNYQGACRRALPYLQASYNKIIHTNHNLLKLEATSVLGIVYMELTRIEESKRMLLELLTLARQYNSIHYEWVAITNLGNCYLMAEDYTRSLEYCEQGLVISNQRNDTLGIDINLSTIAIYHVRLKQYEKAMPPLHLSLEGSIKRGDISAQASTLANLSYCYARTKHPRKAVAFRMAKRGMRLARQLRNKELESFGRGVLANAYWCYGQRLTGVLIYLHSLFLFPPWANQNARYTFKVFLETIFSFLPLQYRK